MGDFNVFSMTMYEATVDQPSEPVIDLGENGYPFIAQTRTADWFKSVDFYASQCKTELQALLASIGPEESTKQEMLTDLLGRLNNTAFHTSSGGDVNACILLLLQRISDTVRSYNDATGQPLHVKIYSTPHPLYLTCRFIIGHAQI